MVLMDANKFQHESPKVISLNIDTSLDSSASMVQLCNAVEEMDSISQIGFSEIEAIARLALTAMENPRTCNDLDSFARAFNCIASKACDVQNMINSVAEGVGCNSIDESERRRWDAFRQARDNGEN